MFARAHEGYRLATTAVIHAIFDPKAHPIARALAELVSGEVDSDRAEYLRRDGWVTGSATTVSTTSSGCWDRSRSRAYSGNFAFDQLRVRSPRSTTSQPSESTVRPPLRYHNLGMLMDALSSLSAVDLREGGAHGAPGGGLRPSAGHS